MDSTGPSYLHNPPHIAHSYSSQVWGRYNYLTNLNEGSPNINRNQYRSLINQLKEAVTAAARCEQLGTGSREIRDLDSLIAQIVPHFEHRRNLDWAQAVYKRVEAAPFLERTASSVDDLLARLSRILGFPFHHTITLIQQARIEDDKWFETFMQAFASASPAPAQTYQAYRNQDIHQLHSLAETVLQRQNSILSSNVEIRGEAENHAARLTKWMIGVTKQKFLPGTILATRLVGEWNHITSTQRNAIYTAEFVSGETVALKVARDRVQGVDPSTIMMRFQKHVHIWHSLRYDHILPFYGVGTKQDGDRTRIYVVSPFLPNRDAVVYQREHECSVQDSLQIVTDLAFALRYLHERDSPIVHFNVCSENVLIDNVGRGVLGGFGFSKELSASESQPTIHPTGLPNDTTRFRAPEYYIDPSFQPKTSADVWGWAMTALQLISGELPFCEASTEFQAVLWMTKGERPNRNSYPNIQQLTDPNSFWQLLEACWADNEADRPTMDEVVPRIKKIKDQNQLGRRDPAVVPAPAPRRRGEGTPIEAVDGQKNQGAVQGRRPQGRD
ncbi:kinase-like protein [Ceratobasidium sp. AG-I]|nr:kinase-like protein [Ceratobasidium sp. AG-I]